MNEPPTSQPTSRLEVRIGLVVVALFAITAVGAIWFKVKHTWGLAWDRLRSPVAVLAIPETEDQEPSSQTVLEPALTPKVEFAQTSPSLTPTPNAINDPRNSAVFAEVSEPPEQPFEYFPNPNSLEIGDFPVEPTSATGENHPPLTNGSGTLSQEPEPAQLATSAQPIANAFATTPILPNDTIWVIAERHYPSPQFAHALWRHNQAKFESPSDLPAGRLLEVPSADYLRHAYPDTFASNSPETNVAQPAASAQEYVIRDGDTLFTIARAQLGATQRWVELFRLNRNVVGDDPTRLPVGQVLSLPAKSAARS
ncbi:MAG: LysM peptidoglycan-binding domain-containing protein [bacterium]|nr:LysM peptidoglycan-binding domain-containing protein [bacterium]